jgi:hypothetical protein
MILRPPFTKEAYWRMLLAERGLQAPVFDTGSHSTANRLYRSANLPADRYFSACGWATQYVDSTAVDVPVICSIRSTDASGGTSATVAISESANVGTVTTNGGVDNSTFPIVHNVPFFWSLTTDATYAYAYFGYPGSTELNEAFIALGNFTPGFLLIGGRYTASPRTWPGCIWGVKVWDAALTREELSFESMQIAPHRAANLIGWYPGLVPGVSRWDTDLGPYGSNLLTTGTIYAKGTTIVVPWVYSIGRPLRRIAASSSGASEIALAATEAPDVFAGELNLDVSLALAATEAPDVFAGELNLDVSLALAATEAPDVFAGELNLDVSLALAATEAPDVFAGTLEVSDAEVSDIALAATEAPDVFAGELNLDIAFALAATEAPDVFAGALEYLDTAEIVMGATEAPDVFAGALSFVSIVAPVQAVGPRFPDRPPQLEPIRAWLEFLQRGQSFAMAVEVSSEAQIELEQDAEAQFQMVAETASELSLEFLQTASLLDLSLFAAPLRGPQIIAAPKFESARVQLDFGQAESELEITVEVS